MPDLPEGIVKYNFSYKIIYNFLSEIIYEPTKTNRRTHCALPILWHA
jgi:hypothetical protein